MKKHLQKNILDMRYTTYLQYFNTIIILLFTYVIGLLVAIVGGQVDYADIRQMLLVFVISFFVSGIMTLLLVHYRERLAETMQQIERL